MITFQFSLRGYDGGTSDTDHLVYWVNAPSRAALDAFIQTRDFWLDGAGVDEIALKEGSLCGVDFVLDAAGRVVENYRERKEP